jgi:hypothetical protein
LSGWFESGGSDWEVVDVDWVSHLSLASIWVHGRNPEYPGLLRKGEPGQGGNPAAKSLRVGQ